VSCGEGAEEVVGERRYLGIGGGAASSSLEESSAGMGVGGGCFECKWQRLKKLYGYQRCFGHGMDLSLPEIIPIVSLINCFVYLLMSEEL